MNKTEDIPGKNPFKVPDNYFEEVNRRIIAATTGETGPVKKPGFSIRLRPYILAAASITGFIIISYTAVRYFTADRTNSRSESITTASFEEAYIDGIDLYTLEESASAIEIPDEISGVIPSEIIDYLMLENIEINEIYEQL
jgi:hypothetical protein